jgi:signal transduction histidine kinase
VVTLEASKLFAELPSAELKALRDMARVQQFEPGQEIFKEGSDGDGVYVVQDGAVEISSLVGPEVRHVFLRVGPGDFFGEMAVIEDKPRSASAVAVEATVAAFVPRADMLRLIERSPTLALRLMREISNRLREFNRQYLSEVLQAERLAIVGRFARSIVHDLKNPLNIISITAEIADTQTSSPELRQDSMVRIRKQVDRISEMINEILEFTQSSHATFVLAPSSYSHFVAHLLQEIRPEAELKGAQIELENEPPEIDLLLNPKRLRRVFHNLINNATDAMPAGGKVILRFRSEPNEVVTEIEDQGTGIAPEISGQLFEAFATHGKVNGTGLGLSICKRIVEDHKGWILARNEPGRGAVFSFGLPLPNREPKT